MDEEIERLLVSVRADTGAFARDVAEMKAQLDGPLAQGVEAAGRAIETALVRALRTGKLGFEDLKKVALSAMAEIASAAYRSGIASLTGGGAQSGGGGGSGGNFGLLGNLLLSVLGASGRATGGPVSPGRSYWVGERGPELFVPTAGGRVQPASGGAREVRISINVNAPGGSAPQALERSGRQVARAVRRALAQVED
jgi:phage-related minor tail protein